MSDLSIHPITGLTALGVGRRGPIWPVMGGSEDAGDAGDAGESASESSDSGEAGDIAPPEKNGWWQFGSKDEASEWANGIVETRLKRERKKTEPLVAEHATLKAEVERLKPLEDATKTDFERWEAKYNTLLEETNGLREFKSSAERTNLVRDLADEKGLPSNFVSRVRGDDADAIAADIDDLLNVLNDGKPRKPASPKPKEADADERGKKGHGGGGGDDDDSFDPVALAKKIRENKDNSFAR